MKIAQQVLVSFIPKMKRLPVHVDELLPDREPDLAHTKRIIRLLEKRQLLIDDAVEKSLGGSVCGFDSRITEEWIVDMAGKDTRLENPSVETSHSEGMICAKSGRCSRHDGWQSIMSRQVELFLREQIDVFHTQSQQIQAIRRRDAKNLRN